VVTEGFDLGFHSLEARLARRNLQLGWFALWSGKLADRLPQEIKPCSQWGEERFGRRQLHAPVGEKGLDPWTHAVFQDLPGIGGDDEIIRPANIVDIVHLAMPRTPVDDRFKSVQHHIADHG
jgi:hypothetical protein